MSAKYKYQIGDLVTLNIDRKSTMDGKEFIVLGYSESNIEYSSVLLGNVYEGHDGGGGPLYNSEGIMIDTDIMRLQRDCWWVENHNISLIHRYILTGRQIKRILS